MPKRPSRDERPAPPEELLEGDDEAPRRRPFWSGTISFGLVTIPVEFYSATRTTRSSLRMLAPSGNPVARRYFREDGQPLESSELERGYELDDGGFVPISDQELEALAPAESRDIDLTRFVDRDAIPALAFERAYVLAPAANSNLAYRLLASTLEATAKVGIASFVMRGKQYAVAISGQAGLLRGLTLRLAEELRTPEAIGLPPRQAAPHAKVETLRRLIHHASVAHVPATELRDNSWQRLEALAEDKRKRGVDIVRPETVEPAAESGAEIIDLVSILRKSLGEAQEAPAEPRPTKRASKSKPHGSVRKRSPEKTKRPAAKHVPKHTARAR